MSLTSLLKTKEFSERFRPLRPKIAPTPSVQAKIPRLGTSATHIGTAFDYMLRWEIERTFRGKLHSRKWGAAVGMEMLADDYAFTPTGKRRKKPDEMFLQWEKLFNDAIRKHKAFLYLAQPTENDYVQAAESCLNLASLDVLYRAGIELAPAPIAALDVTELVQLIRAMCIPTLSHATDVWLNPAFGLGTTLVSGADGDLIIDNTLIDIKTTCQLRINGYYLDQLLGYFMLSRLNGAVDTSAPQINSCALYFSRFASFTVFPTSVWTNQNGFSDFERWFFAATFRELLKQSNVEY